MFKFNTLFCPRCQSRANQIGINTWRCPQCGYTWNGVR